MPQQFPYVGYHFGVFFLFPKFNFDGNFKSVSGLDFSSAPETVAEGGISGFSHSLTNRGSYSSLKLERGFTDRRELYEWCEGTHNTLQTQPCNILISLLDKNEFPVKNWLVFHAIPTAWSTGGLGVDNKTPMIESVSFSYQNFILI